MSPAAWVVAFTIELYAPRFPAASTARTRYRYRVLAESPVSLKVVPVGVPTCAKLVQPDPWHRSTRYPVTPTLSVDAVHDRFT